MMVSSGNPSETYRAVLQRLKEAPPTRYPSPPRARVLALSLLVLLFRLVVAVLLPLFALLLLLWPATGLGGVWLLVAWGKALFRKRKVRDLGVRFDRRTETRLYELADAVAAAVGSPEVSEISVAPDSTYEAFEVRGRGARKLHLTLNFCEREALNLVELASIMTREFAHFGLGHTRHSLRLRRNARFLEELYVELVEGSWRWVNPVYWVLWLFRGITRPLQASIQRQFERQADAAAVSLLGATNFSNSLRKDLQSQLQSEILIEVELRRAVAAHNLKADLMGAVANHELSEDEFRDYSATFNALLERPAERLDLTSSIKDRLEFAMELSREQPELAGLKRLAGEEGAFAFLFGERRYKLNADLSRAMIDAALGRQSSEVGLRGQFIGRAPRLSLPELVARKHSKVSYLVWLFGVGWGVLLLGGLSLSLLVTDERSRGTRQFAYLLLGASLLVLIWLVRLYFVRMIAGESGVTLVGLLGETRLGWDEITAVRYVDSKLEVRGTVGGTPHRLKVRGEGVETRRMLDLVLELSPELSYLGWGTGLARVARPPRTAALPERVFELGGAFHLEGPGASRLVIESEHDAYAAIRTGLESRLMPALLKDV